MSNKRMVIITIISIASIFGFLGFGYVMCVKNVPIKLAESVVDQSGKPTEALCEILKTCAVQHDGKLSTIVDATQRAWLRGAGKERWQIDEKNIGHQESLTGYFQRMNMIDAITPSKKKYDYIVLFGSTVVNIRERLAYLFTLWQQGVRGDKLIVLSGERPLDAAIEPASVLLDYGNKTLPIRADWKPLELLPKTECEMIAMVIDQAQKPVDFEKIAIEFINAPMRTSPDGSKLRPCTSDTVEQWLGTHPKPGSCLCISNQPYCGYQDASVRLFIPDTFTVEVVGQKAKNEKNSIMLDTIARWLYTERDILNKRKP